MRQATFKMVSAGDGAPPTPTGYCYYLFAHAVATVLLLLTLIAAVWQFMDWAVTPSCPASSSSSSTSWVTSDTQAPADSSTTKAGEIRNGSGQAGVLSSWTERPSLYRYAARTEAMADGHGCPCPKAGK
jgi:hypothetical protein